MARRTESEFAKLKRLGVIKSNTPTLEIYEDLKKEGLVETPSEVNEILINQAAQNDLMALNQSDNIASVVKRETGYERVNFTHSFDLVKASDNASLISSGISSRSVEAGESYLRFNEQLNELNIKTLASEKFQTEVIGISKVREDRVLDIFKQSFSNIHNKQDVLDFLNNTKKFSSLEGKIVKNIQELRTEVINGYREVKETYTGSEIKINKKGEKTEIKNYDIDPQSISDLQDKLTTLLGGMKEALKLGVVDSPQFIGFFKLLDGTLYKFLKDNGLNLIGGVGSSQLATGVTTVFELVERVSQSLYMLNNINKGIGFRLEATGSEFDKFLKKRQDELIKKSREEKRPLTYEDYENLYTEYIKELVRIGKPPRTLTGMAAKGVRGSGSEESGGTDDMVMIFNMPDMEEQKVYVDVKLGADSEYTGNLASFRKNEITIKSLIKDGVSLDPQAVKKELEIGLTIFLLSEISGVDKKDLFKDILVNILIYSFIGSKVFIEKFRKQNGDKEIQADLAFIKNQYIWFSKIFETIYDSYFNSKSFRALTIKSNLKTSPLDSYTKVKDIEKFKNDYINANNPALESSIKEIFKSFYDTTLALELTRTISLDNI